MESVMNEQMDKQSKCSMPLQLFNPGPANPGYAPPLQTV